MSIKRFDIDWDGARYRFKESGFPVELKSQIITSSESILTVKLKSKDLTGPFTIDFSGQALVEFDGSGAGLTSTAPYEVEKLGKEIVVTLPFPLLDTSYIDFTGSLLRSLSVVDDLDGSVGRYRLEVLFDPGGFPDGGSTLPRSLRFDLLLGLQGFPGTILADSGALRVQGDQWREAK